MRWSRRTWNENWWPSEATTDADVEQAIAGGPIDVMITLDEPDHV